MQTYTSGSESYSLQYPDHWEFSIDENTVSFLDEENGVGAFQLTEYEFEEEAEFDLSKQLTEMICDFHDLDPAGVSAGIQEDGLKGWTSFEAEDTYWRYWLFVKGQSVLFITYNCEIQEKEIEQEIVQQIIDSIKFA